MSDLTELGVKAIDEEQWVAIAEGRASIDGVS